MGNTHSNRIDDHRRRSEQGLDSRQQRDPLQLRTEDDNELLHLNMNQLNNIQNQKQNNNGQNDGQSLKKRKINSKHHSESEQRITIMASTWYRDSHGLYDYEEDNKISISHFKASQGFVLKRDKDRLLIEEFEDFLTMAQNYKTIQELNPPDFVKIVATCINQVENSEEEKENPGDKLWLVMKHMVSDKDYDFQQGLGFKLEIGDTIKFGRVRYKVIVINNQKDGLQEYTLLDRFQRQRFVKKVDKKKKKGQHVKSVTPTSAHSPNIMAGLQLRVPDEEAISDGNHNAVRRLQTNANFMNRVQSQNTMFGDATGAHMEEDLNIEGNDRNSDDSFSGDNGEDDSSEDTESDAPCLNEDDGEQAWQEELPLESTINNAVNPIGLEGPPNFASMVQTYQGLQPRGSVNDKRTAPVNLFVPTQGNDGAVTHNLASHRPMANEALQNVEQSDFGRTGTLLFNNPNILQSGISGLSADGLAQTQGPSNLGIHNLRKKKRKEKLKQAKEKTKLRLQEQLRLAKEMEGKVCRICLGEENEGVDPLISPCKCAGTMSHIHLECLREWLNSKMSKKESEYVKTYCWKALECELCKVRFPGQVFSNGTILSEKLKLTPKQIKKLGRPIEILEYEKPDSDFMVIESVTLQNIRIVHVITMNEGGRAHIRVGRGHEADIRVTDISVSRFHAKINKNEDGEYFVEDNKSKFGTLIQLRKPYLLHKNRSNYIQMGRTMLNIKIEDQQFIEQSYKESSICKRFPCCPKQKRIIENVSQEISEFYPKEWDPVEEEVDEQDDDKNLNTQAVEQTRDDENLAAQAQLPSPRTRFAGQHSPFGTNDPRGDQNNEEQKLAPERQDAPSRVKFPTEIDRSNANSAALQGLELSTINGALRNNQGLLLQNQFVSLTLGEETVRGTTNVQNVVQERNPIVISSNNFITLNGEPVEEEEKTQNNMNIQNIIDSDINQAAIVDRSSFTEQLHAISGGEQDKTLNLLGSVDQSYIQERDINESNYRTTPGVKDKSFQMQQTEQKNTQQECTNIDILPQSSPIIGGGQEVKTQGLLDTPEIGNVLTGFDKSHGPKIDAILGNGLEASQINFEQSVFLNQTQNSQVSPQFLQKKKAAMIELQESQPDDHMLILNSMHGIGDLNYVEEEKHDNVYSISHSKQLSIISNTDNPLGTPLQLNSKQPILTEAAEESKDDNVFSFNKNRNIISGTNDDLKQNSDNEQNG